MEEAGRALAMQDGERGHGSETGVSDGDVCVENGATGNVGCAAGREAGDVGSADAETLKYASDESLDRFEDAGRDGEGAGGEDGVSDGERSGSKGFDWSQSRGRDVQAEASVQAAVASVVKEFGGIDLLVNNAGAFETAAHALISFFEKAKKRGVRVAIADDDVVSGSSVLDLRDVVSDDVAHNAVVRCAEIDARGHIGAVAIRRR